MSAWIMLIVLSSPVDLADAGKPDELAKTEKGTLQFRLAGDQQDIPERYRLEPHVFPYELELRRNLPNTGMEIYHLRFPSAVTSATPENNTVHAEYYRPKGTGPFPGVIILDITGGDQSLSRTIARNFAQSQVAGLFVQMAYYGPRRPPGSKLRLLSTNLEHTMAAVRQTVLDVRRAAAWLASRPEIDGARLGVHGTSLGSMVGALAAEMEPRLNRVSIALGGGGLVDAFYDHPRVASYRKTWERLGGTKELVAKMLAPIDPITCAGNLKSHKVLMIGARRDEMVPPRATENLWEAAGKPELIWFDCTHFGAALYFGTIMSRVTEHFKAK
jgi:dienelactone hydrolase